MNEGLVAAVVLDNQVEKKIVLEDVVDNPDYPCYLPPDIALVSYANGDPRTLDKALHVPNAKEWQEALDYEISQLEKLGMWVVEDLPLGHVAIPCSKVL